MKYFTFFFIILLIILYFLGYNIWGVLLALFLITTLLYGVYLIFSTVGKGANKVYDEVKSPTKKFVKDTSYKIGEIYSSYKYQESIKKDKREEILMLRKKLIQIERKIDSYKMKKDIGAITKTDQNKAIKLIKQRDEILEKIDEID